MDSSASLQTITTTMISEKAFLEVPIVIHCLFVVDPIFASAWIDQEHEITTTNMTIVVLL